MLLIDTFFPAIYNPENFTFSPVRLLTRPIRWNTPTDRGEHFLTKENASVKQEDIVKQILQSYSQMNYPCRISKYISHAGICSRRAAEDLVLNGSVMVNNIVISDLSFKVKSDDKVFLKKRLIKPQSLRLFLFHKPLETLTSNRSEQGKQTIFDLLPEKMPRVVTVGRLDFNSEGLILLTTNGDVARAMELPATEIERKYKCRIFGHFKKEYMDQLHKGIAIAGVRYRSIKVEPAQESRKKSMSHNNESHSSNRNGWYYITLKEGKNREIRNIIAHFGLKIARLVRVEYGPFKLGKVPKRGVIEIPLSALLSPKA